MLLSFLLSFLLLLFHSNKEEWLLLMMGSSVWLSCFITAKAACWLWFSVVVVELTVNFRFFCFVVAVVDVSWWLLVFVLLLVLLFVAIKCWKCGHVIITIDLWVSSCLFVVCCFFTFSQVRTRDPDPDTICPTECTGLVVDSRGKLLCGVYSFNVSSRSGLHSRCVWWVVPSSGNKPLGC